MSEHAIASRVFARLSESLGDVCSRSDVSCLVWGYGTRTRLEKKTLRRVFCVRTAWFAFGNHEPDLGGCEQSGRSSVLPGLDYRARRPYRYVRIHSTVASLCPARSHTSGTGIHPKEKPQGRREKPRPSYYPQSGGLDETHYQLHQDRIKLQGKHDFFVARHASSSTITSDCEFDTCNNLMRTR
jgi:hypothetical protein